MILNGGRRLSFRIVVRTMKHGESRTDRGHYSARAASLPLLQDQAGVAYARSFTTADT